MSVRAAEQFRVADRSIASLRSPLAIGAKVKLERLPIDGREATLELERFEVWAANAEIKVYGANGVLLETLAPPATRYFRGHVAGDPQSLVFLAVEGDRVDGIVWTSDKRFAVGSRVLKGKTDVFIEEAPVAEETPANGQSREFFCEVENLPVTQSLRPTAMGRPAAPKPPDDGVLATGTARWVLNLAIDTDYELYVNVSSSTANVSTYIGNLVGAASTIYRRDLLTDLRVSYLSIHSSPSDPFTVVPGQSGTWNGSSVTYTTTHALLELGDRWHNAPPSGAARSSTVLVSGKSQTSGVAWVEVLCDPDFAYQGHWGGRYAYCGGIFPPSNLAVPNPNANANYQAPSSNYWPLLQFTHELGHNVGSSHTHCISLSPADQTTYGRAYVDRCYNGQSGCYSGVESVPAERGTIMSYCHFYGGSSTRFTFGQSGEASYVVPADMRSDIQAVTPTMSAISAPPSLGVGSSGTASVTNVAGITYAWTIQNGTINGTSAAASVNFTASAHPVTLSVTATNSVGCAVTDSVNVNGTGNCSFGISPTARSFGAGEAIGTVAVTANCAWTATSNDGWIEIIGGSSGNGNGTVTYLVTANPTNITWVGTLTIAGQTFTVTQTAFDASEHTDFDGDGHADLFWRTPSGAVNAVWLMNGATLASGGYVQSLDGNWVVKGIGDFNADGYADVLWRNDASLQAALWFMNGTSVSASAFLPSTGSAWSIHGVGDFNGDGTADILWRNSSTNEAVVWLMYGATILSSAWVAAPPSIWVVDGVGDFNGNGRADILWRNTSNSQSVVWLMNGAAIDSASYIATPSSVWSVKGVGDFNGDGMADIVWRNSSTSESVIWLMNGLSLLSAGYTPTAASAWNIQAVGDFDANGKADLAWRNSTNGQNAMWFMNGTSIASSTYFATVPDTGFNIVGPK